MSELWDKVKEGGKKYIDLYNPIKKKEKNGEKFENVGSLEYIKFLIWLTLVCVALYMSKCHHGGQWNALGVLGALFCPPLTIVFYTVTNFNRIGDIFPCKLPIVAPTTYMPNPNLGK